MQNETIAIHAGYNKKEGYGSMSVPIVSNNSLCFLEILSMLQIYLH